MDDENSNKLGEGEDQDQEDYLDTLDRKVTEIINRDSRRSSQHDLVMKEEDLYGSLSITYSRNRLSSDLNSNPRFSARSPAPEGAIMFEDDGKETSSDEMNTSREDLTCVWSEEEEARTLFTRRRKEAAAVTTPGTRPMSIVSSEDCPASPTSEYNTTTSYYSNMDSNPGHSGVTSGLG